MSNKIFTEIMREYEKDREQAARLAEVRRAEVYEANPQIKEIDDEIKMGGAELLKSILTLSDSKKHVALMEDFGQKNEDLKNKRRELMEKIGRPFDYVEDVYKCPACKDTGYLEDGRTRCVCMNKRIITKRYSMSGLAQTLEKENFDKFDITLYDDRIDEMNGISPRQNMTLNRTVCEKFADNFGKKYINLFLYGKAGQGKTFLCNCIAKEVIDAGFTVIYQSATQLLKKLEDIRFNKNRDDEFDEGEFGKLLTDSDLLIIDDFGSEMKTIVTMSEIFDIVNTRALMSKPVVISSNLKLEDLRMEYSDRITSRILGHYEMLKFFGKDIRQWKKYR